MKTLLTILITLSMNNSGHRILGKVYDDETHEEIAGVRVISDCDTVYTDLNGVFKIKCLSDSTDLIFSLTSYNTDTLNTKEFYDRF